MMGGLLALRGVSQRLFSMQDNGHPCVAFDESAGREGWFVHNFNVAETLHQFLPQYLKLKFSETIADAAVDAKAERDMTAGILAIDNVVVRAIPEALVAVSGNIPHGDLIALLDGLAVHLDIFKRCPAHVCQRRLPANGF